MSTIATLTLSDRQWAALGRLTAHYCPDTGDKVELEPGSQGQLVVRVFNGRLRPREIRLDRSGREV